MAFRGSFHSKSRDVLGDDAPFGRYISKSLKEKVLARDGHKCTCCGATEYLEFDHAIPKAMNGLEVEDNIQVLCRKCNSEKGAKRWWGPTLKERGIRYFGGNEELLKKSYRSQGLVGKWEI